MRMIDADMLEDALVEYGVPVIVKGKTTSAWGVPIIEVNLRPGHWIYEGNAYVAKCSMCRNSLDMRGISGDANFCPYCGAKMDGVAE